MKRFIITAVLILVFFLACCAAPTQQTTSLLEDEIVALDGLPTNFNDIVFPSGKLVAQNAKAVIDYSNTKDGYVMVKFTKDTNKRLKTQVIGPTTTYTYNIPLKEYVAFPLSDGNGKYTIKVFEQVSGSKYSVALSTSFDATLSDEFAPFVRPNQYVSYDKATKTVAKAKEIAGSADTALQKTSLIYSYVVQNMTYDKEKATTVQSGYLPNLDEVLAAKKGICFDYAALMTGMLRSLGVPCKLVVGYAGTAYHAWISVWSETEGWINGAIYFDGTTWQRMDPTFASSGKESAAIMSYIGDGTNYTSKYFY